MRAHQQLIQKVKQARPQSTPPMELEALAPFVAAGRAACYVRFHRMQKVHSSGKLGPVGLKNIKGHERTIHHNDDLVLSSPDLDNHMIKLPFFWHGPGIAPPLRRRMRKRLQLVLFEGCTESVRQGMQCTTRRGPLDRCNQPRHDPGHNTLAYMMKTIVSSLRLVLPALARSLTARASLRTWGEKFSVHNKWAPRRPSIWDLPHCEC